MKLRHARKRRSPASLRRMRVKAALMRVARTVPFASLLPPMTFRYGSGPMISHPGWSRGGFVESLGECIRVTARPKPEHASAVAESR